MSRFVLFVPIENCWSSPCGARWWEVIRRGPKGIGVSQVSSREVGRKKQKISY